MSRDETNLFEKWISVKFDGKTIISASKKGQYVNVRLSLINGKQYQTKFGPAMSVQLGYNDIVQMIEALTEIKDKHLHSPASDSMD